MSDDGNKGPGLWEGFRQVAGRPAAVGLATAAMAAASMGASSVVPIMGYNVPAWALAGAGAAAGSAAGGVVDLTILDSLESKNMLGETALKVAKVAVPAGTSATAAYAAFWAVGAQPDGWEVLFKVGGASAAIDLLDMALIEPLVQN